MLLGVAAVSPGSASRDAQAILDRLLAASKVAISDARKKEEPPSLPKTFLEKGELIEVYSLEPLAAKDEKGKRLHGYKVLGKIAVKDARVRKQLTREIAEALVPAVYSNQLMATLLRAAARLPDAVQKDDRRFPHLLRV